MYTLSEADACVVDEFMETRNAAGDGGAGGGGPQEPHEAGERMAAVMQMFELIGVMPVFEPADDLAARTLQAVGRMERRRRRADHAGELDAAEQIRPQL